MKLCVVLEVVQERRRAAVGFVSNTTKKCCMITTKKYSVQQIQTVREGVGRRVYVGNIITYFHIAWLKGATKNIHVKGIQYGRNQTATTQSVQEKFFV
jgi:hypothetical protein